jgi:hypothetical protein
LGHGPIGRADHQDGPIHLRRPGDHVLDVVGVAGAVHVRVVALVRLVLDVGDGNRDAARLLLGGLVDGVVGAEAGHAARGQRLGDGRGQRGLAMVDVPDRAHVHVRLGALKDLLAHYFLRPSG